MGRILDQPVGDIRNPEIMSLINELEEACSVGSHQHLRTPLVSFLTTCVYPQGVAAGRSPINPAYAPNAPILESRVGKLPEGDLRVLCNELALSSGVALEYFSPSKVYVLLNKTLPKYDKPKAPSLKQRRSDAVALRRRFNR